MVDKKELKHNNKRSANIVLGIFLLIGLTCLLIAGGVLITGDPRLMSTTATFNLTNASGTQVFSQGMTINEDQAYAFNMSVNHSGFVTLQNLTDINISFWGNFNVTSNSIKITNLSAGASNATYNDSGAAIGSGGFSTMGGLKINTTTLDKGFLIAYAGLNSSFFQFNLTSYTPGKYNITIRFFYNASGNPATGANFAAYNETNITIKVNDTTVPLVLPVNLSATDSGGRVSNNTVGNYNSGTNLILNISASDNGGAIRSVFFNLTNVSGYSNTSTFYKGTNASTSTSNWNVSIDTTKLPDGNYTLYAYVNDSNGNLNATAKLNFTIDNTAPTGTMTCSPTDAYVGTSLTCTCSASDLLAGLSSTTYTASPSTTTAGADLTQTCTALDLAGNTGTITSNKYTIWGSPSSGGSSGGSSSSGGTTATFTYTTTIPQTSQDLSQMQSIQTSSFTGGGLAAKEKVTFKLGTAEHYVGIRTLTTSSATIEIASTPTQVDLAIGQSTKRDLDNDGFYDIEIKLNGITNGKADLTITYIHEAVSGGTTTPSGEETTGTPSEETPQPTGMPVWAWIVIGLVVLAIIIGGGIAMNKKKRK